MIRLRGVSKTYRTGKVENRVLRGVDLEIGDGEFVALVGRSGSGKTTLLNIIGGLDTDYEGAAEFNGRDLRRMGDAELSGYRNQHVGFIFQSFHLLEHLTCRENVLLPAQFARGSDSPSEAALNSRADEVLELVDLAEKANDPPTTLSGGQKQRVAIARALFNRPSLMICDEPTGNLDRETADSILDTFRQLNEEQGITLVLVTHDPAASAAANRVVEVIDGQVRGSSSGPAQAQAGTETGTGAETP
jgi:ABC-type lipoprotein export system ATPase subunit